jgi:hypothetical protein
MRANRRPRASRALLALVFWLAVLGPGAAGRPAAGGEVPTSLAADPVVGLGQGLLHERARSLVAPFGKRDDRERPGLALPGLLAAAVATASMVVAGRLAGRAGGRRAATAGARDPPRLQPAPT